VVRHIIPADAIRPTQSGVTPAPIRIVGEHLSPKAQVWLNGWALSAGMVSATPPDVEFANELVLTPDRIASPGPGVPTIKVTNPDGQSAEVDAGSGQAREQRAPAGTQRQPDDLFVEEAEPAPAPPASDRGSQPRRRAYQRAREHGGRQYGSPAEGPVTALDLDDDATDSPGGRPRR
jgi:hypothetical protein